MAAKFWVGGTGTWDASTTTHWANSSGGAGGQTAPGSGDTATFDASSGGGTVTVTWAGGTVTVQSIACGAFTGTLDFKASDNNVTLSSSTGFVGSGTGTRTIYLGDGTYTLSGTTAAFDFTTTTNLTFEANGSTILFNGAAAVGNVLTTGGLTFNNVTASDSSVYGYLNISGTLPILNTVTITGRRGLILAANTTTTLTTLSIQGTSASAMAWVSHGSLTSTLATLSIASNAPDVDYCNVRGITATGGASFVANNSVNQGLTTGWTINGITGGAVSVIGG